MTTLSDLDRLRLLTDALRVFAPEVPPLALRPEQVEDAAAVLTSLSATVGPLGRLVPGMWANVAQPTAAERAAVTAPPARPGFLSRLSAWLRQEEPAAPAQLPYVPAKVLASAIAAGPRQSTVIVGAVASTEDGRLVVLEDEGFTDVHRRQARLVSAVTAGPTELGRLSTRVETQERTVTRSDGSGFSYDDVIRTPVVAGPVVTPATVGPLARIGGTPQTLWASVVPGLEQAILSQLATASPERRAELPPQVLKPLLLSATNETRLAATQWVGQIGLARSVSPDAAPAAVTAASPAGAGETRGAAPQAGGRAR